MARKILPILGGLFAVGLSSLGFLWYLSFGVATDPDEPKPLRSITSPVVVEVRNNGTVSITASDEIDFLAGLGYAHGVERAWTALLLRQAALGRLAEWFGERALPGDALVRELGIPATAREQFESLPTESRSALFSYAEGITQALSSTAVSRRKPLVLLDIAVEPWKAWHSVAVERLWAWLAADVLSDSSGIFGRSALFQADSSLRNQLHLFGFEHNLLIGRIDLNAPEILFRYVTGDTAVPPYLAVEYRDERSRLLEGLSVPGTIMIPVGRRGGNAWALLQRSRRRIVLGADSTEEAALDREVARDERVTYDRLRDTEQKEYLIAIRRSGAGVPLVAADRMSDVPDRTVVQPNQSEWNSILEWNGLSESTDTRAWLNLIRGLEPSFSLFEEDGLWLRGRETLRVSGRPSFARQFSTGEIFVSNAPEAPDISDRLQQLIDSGKPPREAWDLLSDTRSTVVASRLAGLVSALDSIPDLSILEMEALAYLKNWDLNYRGASIAAAIFETVYSFQPAPADSTDQSIPERWQLQSAISRLASMSGTDTRNWRWESVQPGLVYFPGWFYAGRKMSRNVREFSSAFQPVRLPGSGHPSTIDWGPSLSDPGRPASASAVGVVGGTTSGKLEYSVPNVAYSTFLGRSLADNRAPTTVGFGSFATISFSTRLLPANE